MKTTCPDDLAPCIEAGFELIKIRPCEKTPQETGWRKLSRTHAEIRRHMEDGGNVGWRLNAGDLAVDVDPRNFAEGDDPMARLAKDVGLDLNSCPHVKTGSGGDHYYFTKPPDLEIVNEHPDYRGVEFKTEGRQMVVPGSVHPCGERYLWDDSSPSPSQRPPAPPGLLSLIARSVSGTRGGKGRFTPEQLAEMLDALDPSEFRDHDTWFQLMCACHHATGGKGCEAFVAWSTSDPPYTGDKEPIRRRWGTLGKSSGKGSLVTAQTLIRYVREAGGTIPGERPEDVFQVLSAFPHETSASNGEEHAPESEESLIEVVERLAKLSLLEYDQQRKAEAEALGVTLKNLDKSVEKERAKHGTDHVAQGTEIVFPDILPAEDPVDGSVLLTQLMAILTRYLVLPSGAAVTIVLWVMRAFAHDLFEINPRLAARSPEKQCGKTTLLEFLSMIVPRPLLSSNCTPASIFRIIEKCQPTLLVDEMDTFQDSHEELRGILNSGHTRAAARVIRTVGDDHEPRAFSTWCPMVLAAIGKLADTLEDRSLRIDLQRKKPSDKVQRFPRKGPALKALQDELGIMQRQCVRWVTDHVGLLSVAEPDSLPELSDRANDNWYSLLSIADVIGGDWPGQARLAAVTISGEDTDAMTIGVQLLADIRDIFESHEVDRISSKELCEELAALEERPWETWRKGRPITMNQVARMLDKFNVKSQTIRFPNKPSAKGYYKANFAESWERYGVHRSENQDSKSYKVTTAMNTGPAPDSQEVTEGSCNLSDTGTKAKAGMECNSVTVQNQDSGAEHTQPDLLDSQRGEAEIDL